MRSFGCLLYPTTIPLLFITSVRNSSGVFAYPLICTFPRLLAWWLSLPAVCAASSSSHSAPACRFLFVLIVKFITSTASMRASISCGR